MSLSQNNKSSPQSNTGLIAYISCSSPEFKSNIASPKETHLREAAKKLGYKSVEVFTVANGHMHKFAQEDSAKILLAAQNMAESNLAVHVAVENHKKCMHYINKEMQTVLRKNCDLISELDEIFITAAQQEHENELEKLEPLDEEEKKYPLIELLIKAIDAAKRVLTQEKADTTINSR